MGGERRVSESAQPRSVNVCAQGPFVMHRMENAPLIAKEWNQVAWGNFETNLEFLRRVGFGAGHLTVLEIGCGKGALLSRLQAMGHRVWGIDTDLEAIAFCKANYPEIGACVGLGEKLPFGDHVFDTVLSFDVFEHIADSDQHLREVRRVLKPAGAYLLQTPNKWTNIPFEVLRHHRKLGISLVASYHSLLEDHCALHSYWELRRRFERHGFKLTFVSVPVVNDYFRAKMREYLGALGPALLGVLNPDRFPLFMRTNFYARGVLR
jgi:SAM-dependent methyltransferase